MEFTKFADPAVAPANLLPSLLFSLDDNIEDFKLLFRKQGTDTLSMVSDAAPLAQILEGDAFSEYLKLREADLDHPVYMLPERLTFQPRSLVLPGAGGLRASEFPLPAALTEKSGAAEVAEIGILDAGMAFWNPAFWDKTQGQSRFASVSELRMEPGKAVARVDLPPDRLTEMAARGHNINGDRKNRAEMAELFKSSVFVNEPGERDLAPARALSHGTAMADMILTTAPAEARLHSMELPRRALRDLSGATMRSILHLAVRELVLQAAEQRDDNNGFRMVVLVAFGFVGGPKTAEFGLPDVLANLQQTIVDLGQKGITLELVLPMGNHRQDRLHCRVKPGQPVSWRLQPDDHSTNTLELFHPEPLEKLAVTAPDGSQGVWTPAQGAVSVLRMSGGVVGALWTEKVAHATQSHWRSRLSLMPTAGRIGFRAPFGLWTVTLPEATMETEAWILRDETGFELDPARPMRSSWLEDPNYRKTNALGLPQMSDEGLNGDPMVLRSGTASVLALGSLPGVVTVGAQWRDPATDALHIAPYSGAAALDTGPDKWSPLDTHAAPSNIPNGPFGQRAVLGNGSDQRFRVSGTSLAAALVAGEMAAV